jgi:hypothetical protein
MQQFEHLYSPATLDPKQAQPEDLINREVGARFPALIHEAKSAEHFACQECALHVTAD